MSFHPVLTISGGVLFRISDIRLGGVARGSFYNYSPDYNAGEVVPIAVDGKVFRAAIRHHLATAIQMIDVGAYVRCEPLSFLGFEVGIPYFIPVQSTYTQTQKFTDPDGLHFVDGSVEQLTARGDVPGMRNAIGVGGRVDVAVPVSSIVSVEFFASAQLPLRSINTNTDWRPFNLGAGLGLRMNLLPAPEPPPPPRPTRSDTTRDTVVSLSINVIEPQTSLVLRTTDSIRRNDTLVYVTTERYRTLIRKPPSLLRVSVKVGFEQRDGSVSDDARLLSMRTQRTRTVPVLPVVMFDSGSGTIPARYQQLRQRDALRWTEQRLTKDTATHWQYNVLNVIGSRMKRLTTSTVEIQAYDDGTPTGAEQARTRARAVQQYLIDAFRIPAQRLPMVTQTDARLAQTDGRTPIDVSAEAQWVYLRDKTAAISAPISMRDTITESQLPKVRIVPEIVSEAGLSSWSVQLTQRGRSLRTFADSASMPKSVLWDMRDDVTMDAVLQAPVDVEITATDNEGTTVRGEPGRISLQGSAITDASSRLSAREEVLMVQSLDNLRTPDADMLPVAGQFRRTLAPREGGWFRRGLSAPELALYSQAAVYINEERRP